MYVLINFFLFQVRKERENNNEAEHEWAGGLYKIKYLFTHLKVMLE